MRNYTSQQDVVDSIEAGELKSGDRFNLSGLPHRMTDDVWFTQDDAENLPDEGFTAMGNAKVLGVSVSGYYRNEGTERAVIGKVLGAGMWTVTVGTCSEKFDRNTFAPHAVGTFPTDEEASEWVKANGYR